VDEQFVQNSIALGDGIPEIAHEVCPGEQRDAEDRPVMRKFRAQVVVAEIPADVDADAEVVLPAPTIGDLPLELIAGTGKTVEARTAAEAVNGPLTVWLNGVWPQMQEHAAFADLPAPTPTTDA
jgi:hypothetical protein